MDSHNRPSIRRPPDVERRDLSYFPPGSTPKNTVGGHGFQRRYFRTGHDEKLERFHTSSDTIRVLLLGCIVGIFGADCSAPDSVNSLLPWGSSDAVVQMSAGCGTEYISAVGADGCLLGRRSDAAYSERPLELLSGLTTPIRTFRSSTSTFSPRWSSNACSSPHCRARRRSSKFSGCSNFCWR